MAMAVAGTSMLALRVAAVLGASAVGLGAYGAHGFKPQDPYFSDVFRRANNYHILHALLIAASPVARYPRLVAGLATTGILFFSGSCYAVALTEDRTYGKLAPYGGMTLMAAWLALAL